MIATNSKSSNYFLRKLCFLCNNKTKSIITEKLKLYHFGNKKIGYGICNKCGLVMQTISPSNKELISFYKQNFYFEDFKKPKKMKIDSINRQIRLIKQESDKFPKSILEVSLMSIYNLLQFRKEGAKLLHGIEPSLILNNKIKKKHNIKIFNNIIEKFKSNISYDLILMSHVLEHLPNPLKAINQCYKNQKLGQKILVEVPLFDRTELYPPSGLNVEHLYYFDENNLTKLINKAGYEILVVEKIYQSTQLPFISILAKKVLKNRHDKKKDISSYKKQIEQIINYKKTINKIYNRVNKVLKTIDTSKPSYLFGSGFTASNFINYTDIISKIKIKGIFDNSKVKENKYLDDLQIISPKTINQIGDMNIILTSIGSNESILKQLSNVKAKINFYGFEKNYNFKKLK